MFILKSKFAELEKKYKKLSEEHYDLSNRHSTLGNNFIDRDNSNRNLRDNIAEMSKKLEILERDNEHLKFLYKHSEESREILCKTLSALTGYEVQKKRTSKTKA